MDLFKIALRSVLTLTLPLFIFANVYSLIHIDMFGGADWSNWRDSYFGFRSLVAVFDSLGNFNFKLFLSDFRSLLNTAIGDVPVLVEELTDATSTLDRIWFGLQFVFRLLTAPFTILYWVFKLIIDFGKFIILLVDTFIKILGGYFNTPNPTNSGWNSISDYVYTM